MCRRSGGTGLGYSLVLVSELVLENFCVVLNVSISDWKKTPSTSIYLSTKICWSHVSVFKDLQMGGNRKCLINQKFQDTPAVPPGGCGTCVENLCS